MIKYSRLAVILVTLHLMGSMSLAANCPVGMISYWTMEEDSSQPGFIGYVDVTGNTHTGVCAGACPAVNVQGLVDRGQDFNGLDTGIFVPASDVYDWSATDSFSLELWMKRSAGISSREIMIGRDDTTSALQWYVGIESNGRAVFFVRSTDGASQTLVGTKRLDNDVWHHIVAVRDSGSNINRLYVDGQLEAALVTSYSTGFESTSPVNFGYLSENSLPAFHYNGTIDELSIYNRSLDESFIQAHYYLSKNYCSQYDDPVKIMPLGDSITYDDYSGDIRPTSERVAYRLPLWTFLDSEMYWFDFVGGLVAGEGFSFFDPDNEGHPGFTDAQVASAVYGYLSNNPADLILLHIGTNDLDPDPGDVESILDEIDRYSENITVAIARIIEHVGDDGTTNTFNDAVEGMANLRIADGDKIVMVDMEDGAGIDYTIGVDMIDIWHPNINGYQKMADKWVLSLNDILLRFAPPDISGIPDQTIDEGSVFTDISLDDYISDYDNPDSEILWVYSGNSDIEIAINERVAAVSVGDQEWNGSETVTFRATDPGGLFNEYDVSFTVTAINDQPVIQGSGALDTDKNTALELSLNALSVVDPDNTYPDDFNLTVYDGMNYTRAGDTITPVLDFVGTLSVPVSVNDGNIESNVVNIIITVTQVNTPPEIISKAPTTVTKGLAYIYTPTGIDIENDSLSWVLDTKPEGMTIDGETGRILWIPDQDVNTSGPITLIVADGNGGSDSENFIVQVTDDDSGGGGSSGCFIQTIL